MSLDVWLKKEVTEYREVYSRNITHNLNTMAMAAGIYMHLWRPEEIGITKAAQLIEPLRAGLELLRAEPRVPHSCPKRQLPWGQRMGVMRT